MINEFFLRKVNEKDIKGVLKLSNKEYVRKYSLNREKIKWEEHLKWFTKVLQSQNDAFYIVTNKDYDFLGQIRYKIEDCNATVSISLCEKVMGKGLSCNLLIESMENLKVEYKDVKSIRALISIENILSKRLFEKANYRYLKVSNEIMEYVYNYE